MFKFNPLKLIDGKILSFKFCTKCNIKCSDCIELYDHGEEVFLKDASLFLQVINQAKKADFSVVIFQGGEPTLYTDLIKKGIEECKKVKLISMVLTSGWFGKDNESIKSMFENFTDLDVLTFSLDYWHQEYVPIEYINNIINYVDSKKINIFMAYTQVISKHHKEKPKLNKFLFQGLSDLLPYGSSFKNLYDGDIELKKFNGELHTCKSIRYTINPNGNMVPSCGNDGDPCAILGNIKTDEIKDMINKISWPRVKLYGHFINHCHACRLARKNGINLSFRDERFNDPSFLEIIDENKFLPEYKTLLENKLKEEG